MPSGSKDIFFLGLFLLDLERLSLAFLAGGCMTDTDFDSIARGTEYSTLIYIDVTTVLR